VRAALDSSQGPGLQALVRDLGASLPYGLPQGREVVLHCRTSTVFEVVAALQGLGAHDVTVRAFDYLFRPTNALTERLLRRLG